MTVAKHKEHFSLATVKEKVTQAGKYACSPDRHSSLPWSHPGFVRKTHLEAVATRSKRILCLLKKLAGTTWEADTNILRRVYTGTIHTIMEYATTSWATVSMPTRAGWTKSKMSHCESLLVPRKQYPSRRWSPWNSEEHLKLLPRWRGHRDYLVICSTTSSLPQPKRGWKDRASTIWPVTSGEHRKTFWFHRSMRKTSSVVETGTREISDSHRLPGGTWSAPCWTKDINIRWPWLRRWLWYPQADWAHTLTAQRKMLLEMEAVACLSRPQYDKQIRKCYRWKMLKFQSKNLSIPDCSSLCSRPQPQKDCHFHTLKSSPSVPNVQHLWLANPSFIKELFLWRSDCKPPWSTNSQKEQFMKGLFALLLPLLYRLEEGKACDSHQGIIRESWHSHYVVSTLWKQLTAESKIMRPYTSFRCAECWTVSQGVPLSHKNIKEHSAVGMFMVKPFSLAKSH